MPSRELILPRPLLEAMHAHAEAGYPHEVVGILAGSAGAHRVDVVVDLINERSDSPANRYRVSALALARRQQQLEAEGHAILGYYHSHPDHPARYSDFDRDHALPNLSYVIVSVDGGRAGETLSWRLRDDRSAMDPEPITTPTESP